MLFFQITLFITTIYHSKSRNIFSLLINKKWLKLMKKRRYFYYKLLKYTITNCFKNIIKIIIVLKIVRIALNNNKISGKK